MCDYSLHSVKSRPAKIGDKLTTRDFGTGTRGFAASENPSVAVCVLPGTELAFAHQVLRLPTRLWPWHNGALNHKTAIFRQINKGKVATHHDALECNCKRAQPFWSGRCMAVSGSRRYGTNSLLHAGRRHLISANRDVRYESVIGG